jgi:hypothetical protein
MTLLVEFRYFLMARTLLDDRQGDRDLDGSLAEVPGAAFCMGTHLIGAQAEHHALGRGEAVERSLLELALTGKPNCPLSDVPGDAHGTARKTALTILAKWLGRPSGQLRIQTMQADASAWEGALIYRRELDRPTLVPTSAAGHVTC